MGNGLNSSAIVRDYPSGPPFCTQCPPGELPNGDGGWIGVPTNASCLATFGPGGCTPMLQGFASSALVFLYSVWGATLLAAIYWACVRGRLTGASSLRRVKVASGRIRPGGGGTRKDEDEADDDEEEEEEDMDDDDIEMRDSYGERERLLKSRKPKQQQQQQAVTKTKAKAKSKANANAKKDTDDELEENEDEDDTTSSNNNMSAPQSSPSPTSFFRNQHRRESMDEDGSGRWKPFRDEPIMTVEYLRESMAERVAWGLILFNGLLLLAYYLLLTFDFYLECQNVFGGVDNACFFGAFRVFGNYENNASVFFVVWCALVAYVIALSFWWRELLHWVRMPASAETATKARVWIQDELYILASGRLSWAVKCRRSGDRAFRRVRARIARAIWGLNASIEAQSQGRYATVDIHTTSRGRRFFLFECVRYSVPNEVRVPLILENPTIGSIRGYRSANGPNPATREDVADLCGPNAIELEFPSYVHMLAEEFITPFYAYQLTIYLIWIWWTYWFVGLWLLLIVVGSGIWSVRLKRASLREVHRLAEHHDEVEVMRNQKSPFVRCDARELVCGDVVRVGLASQRKDWIVPADLVITDGSCAVDESGLTGESMPRSKFAISNVPREASQVVSRNDAQFRGSILFAGTKVLDASPDCTAVVLAVGAEATRGQLLSHVLFPVKTLFRFDEEFAVAVGILLVYALCAFAIALGLQKSNGSLSSWATTLAYGVFTVSQIVSPLLKIALVAGRVAAMSRLKHKGIACVDANRIDISGKVRLFCFDKTGTLTQDGLTFIGFTPVGEGDDGGASSPRFAPLAPDFSPAALRAAATCHSLALLENNFLGSAVEVSMFQATRWRWVTGENVPDCAVSPSGSIKLVVHRRNQFDQTTRTMSVVVALQEQQQQQQQPAPPLVVYVKGAPESVAHLCSSGVPPDFQEQVDRLASEGCYVLAMASRSLGGTWSVDKARETARKDLEQDLHLLGLVVFRNEIKHDAASAMARLKMGNVRCVMITGDNAPCGCFVARQCGMADGNRLMILGSASSDSSAPPTEVEWRSVHQVPGYPTQLHWESTSGLLAWLSESDAVELAVTGDAFDRLMASGHIYERRILFKIRVFARMNPAQKKQAVECFMEGENGVVCAMVGDGGNDSGALRAAHVGLSMSAAEASLVAPFNASGQNVSSCVDLIIEGRASLATSLASYKLLVIYGLLFSIVKFCSFYYAVLMSLMGYVMIDIVAMVPLTFAMTLSAPLDELGPKRPTSSLLGVQTVCSVVGFITMSAVCMGVNLAIMTAWPGYVKWPSQYADTGAWWFISDNWEATVLWVTAFLMFISGALVFSFGAGFRKTVLTNYILMVIWLALFLFTSFMFLLPLNWPAVVFHFASQQFNIQGTDNPVWQRYQEGGGKPSPAMPFDLRLCVWLIIVTTIGVVIFWERAVVYGATGKSIKIAYGRWRRRRGWGKPEDGARNEFFV